MSAVFAVAPALPLGTAGKYVAAAYIVVLAVILIYFGIMAVRAQRLERELDELRRDVEAARAEQARERESVRMSELLAIGVSHKTAPVEVRERLALPEPRVTDFLRDLRGAADVHEAVAVSTCNRTELYLVVGDPVEAESRTLAMLARQAGIRPTGPRDRDLLAPQLRRRAPSVPGHGRFRLDDRRRGRGPGPGQARLRDGAHARDDRAADQPPVHGGARDRQAGSDRDRDRRGPAQPAGGRRRARARAARAIDGRKVVIIGTGETSELAARALSASGTSAVFVANRRRDRALSLARRYGGTTLSFDELPEALLEADIVVAATASPHLLLEVDDIAAVMRDRERAAAAADRPRGPA